MKVGTVQRCEQRTGGHYKLAREALQRSARALELKITALSTGLKCGGLLGRRDTLDP